MRRPVETPLSLQKRTRPRCPSLKAHARLAAITTEDDHPLGQSQRATVLLRTRGADCRVHLTCLRAPHDGGSVRGATERVTAEAVPRFINTEGFVSGTGREEEPRRESTAADSVCVVPKGAK
ncbi:hypothetical protein EYF80_005243 [Liparis tanakae]|uniref:Uncharacterized protein n=1 Tax=Liparis tanakae TaxID=230148 RepID=A0A4Z2J4W4_9TELE|nr:hypothetical protein EYF80_005243 [Liparis tanakae]